MKEKRIFAELEEISEHDDSALDVLRPRLIIAAVVVVVFAVLIFGRLWFLQVSNSEEYISKAYNNRVRVGKLAPPRGHILDRNGTPLVTNRPSFNVLLVREDAGNDEKLLKRLAEVLGLDVSVLWERIREYSNIPLHIPIRLEEDIDWQTLAYLENHNHEFSGVRIEVTPRRVYHFGNLAAHLIGYLGSISKKELERLADEGYDGSDTIGKMGFEKLRENDLRGEKGESISEVNARGFEQQLLKRTEPLPGNEIQLTIDVGLQRVAEESMDSGGKAGAVVALEVNTGRVLALASTPEIRLEEFVGGISHDHWNAYLNDEKKPLLNKAVQGLYPPASTYKMITAFAGLDRGVINADSMYYCPGYYSFGNRIYRCWKHSGHGAVDLKRAIAESCDVYFYQVGQQVGVDGLAEYARMFALGEKTGLEIENEKSGLVPTKKWKLERDNIKWQEGETLSIAIGQGFNLVTPLQIAVMTTIIANGGKKYLPQLVEKVTSPDGTVVEQLQPQVVQELTGMEEHLRLIREGMFEVVQGKRGTARIARIDGIDIAGKTGTAQVVRIAQYKNLKEEDIPYKFRDHAWFTCYAPADNPEIAVTVLVEHGLHGSTGASPIAKAVLEEYFADRLIEENADENNK
ncbi:MAG: penicillin-binding protein 2 [Desulfopila sp.]|jgi:penicillin-binding protein 2|nr:penicillin-binding protein 2 [Desulfopila sp.]